jgi:hypothetical protein
VIFIIEMKRLVDVVKGDVASAGRMIREVSIGAVRGIYAPFLFNRYLNEMKKEVQDGNISGFQGVSRFMGTIASAALIQGSLASYMIANGKGKEYFGALAFTNVTNYLVNANRRSKELK